MRFLCPMRERERERDEGRRLVSSKGSKPGGSERLREQDCLISLWLTLSIVSESMNPYRLMSQTWIPFGCNSLSRKKSTQELKSRDGSGDEDERWTGTLTDQVSNSRISSRNYNSSSTSAESEGESDGGPSSDESEKSESVNQWRSSSASDSSQPPSSEFKSTYVKNRSFDSRRSSFSVDHSGTEDSDVSHQTESSNLSSLFDDAKGYDGKMPGMGRSTSSESVATTSSFRSAVEIK